LNHAQQTVSRAINNKSEIRANTRQRVLAVAEQLGYRPSSIARGLATNRTLTIGLVVPDIANPFFSEIARGAEDMAHQAGYSLLLGNSIEDPEREADVLRTLEEKRVDGIVLCSSRLPDDVLMKLAVRYPAAVLVNRHLLGSHVDTICVDDATGARLATRYLLQTGHRTIAFLAGPPMSHSGQRRAQGYVAGLAEAGLPDDPTLQIACSPYQEGGLQAARTLLTTRPDLDAFVCYNDLVAVGALQACAALGRRMPEDVAVIGCDDISLAALVTPPLTTLRVAKRELGASAVQILLDRLAGRKDGYDEIVLQPRLIVRASTRRDETTSPHHWSEQEMDQ